MASGGPIRTGWLARYGGARRSRVVVPSVSSRVAGIFFFSPGNRCWILKLADPLSLRERVGVRVKRLAHKSPCATRTTLDSRFRGNDGMARERGQVESQCTPLAMLPSTLSVAV